MTFEERRPLTKDDLRRKTTCDERLAIYTKLQVGELNLETESFKSEKRTNWAKATDVAITQYKSTLAIKLNTIPTPDCGDCQDLHCRIHSSSLEDYTVEVLQAVESSAREAELYRVVSSARALQ